ncbi:MULTISPECIES: DUF2000 family protein [unclassified Variovorax]|uniref:DUF2000 family protein n=1 Tax=unclassified Variovorax TaxID=663243 RepID=UPI002575F758|nr:MULTISPECIES: DUF2000 family protein [unclassified Variovorax]MDM0088661.1 DUF2000 family protein [Variovorax sp. J22G40]MDM0146734.1 DUF2000 family protein [Variovorax sp. J2P1-31]
MAYSDNARKTVLVLNAEFPITVLLNAVAHVALGLRDAHGAENWRFLDYPSPAFGANSRISEYPVIVLRCKRSASLEKLVMQLKTAGIAHNVFMESMLGSSATEQQRRTLEATPGSVRIVCVSLVGEETEIRPFIKSHTLYSLRDTAHALGADTKP